MTSLPSPWEADANASAAESGQAHVFRVRRVSDPATYALKRLKDPKRSGRFEREVKAMKELREAGFHSVPPIVDDGVDRRGRGYYVMPWYEAAPFKTRLTMNDSGYTPPLVLSCWSSSRSLWSTSTLPAGRTAT